MKKKAGKGKDPAAAYHKKLRQDLHTQLQELARDVVIDVESRLKRDVSSEIFLRNAAEDLWPVRLGVKDTASRALRKIIESCGEIVKEFDEIHDTDMDTVIHDIYKDMRGYYDARASGYIDR